jgi:hypothetical protein
MILDSQSHHTVSVGLWDSLEGLAWSPSGKEVWFAASSEGESWADQIRAVDLSGKQRMLLRLPGSIRLHDVFRDGRMLITQETWRTAIGFRGPQDAKDRDLSWFDFSTLTDLSPDGSALVFGESGASSASSYFLYLRKTDGSPALKLGEGEVGALSPDGKWVLTVSGISSSHLALLPTGTGEIRYLQDFGLKKDLAPSWTPDGQQVVYAATDGQAWRIYIQDLQGGKPHPVTPEIAAPPDFVSQLVSPNGKFVFSRDSQQKAWLYPLDGSSPIAVAGFGPDDTWANWGSDSRTAYVYRQSAESLYPLKIFKLDLITEERKLFRELMPEDPVGLGPAFSVRVSSDAQSLAYDYERSDSELYLVTGLK